MLSSASWSGPLPTCSRKGTKKPRLPRRGFFLYASLLEAKASLSPRDADDELHKARSTTSRTSNFAHAAVSHPTSLNSRSVGGKSHLAQERSKALVAPAGEVRQRVFGSCGGVKAKAMLSTVWRWVRGVSSPNRLCLNDLAPFSGKLRVRQHHTIFEWPQRPW